MRILSARQLTTDSDFRRLERLFWRNFGSCIGWQERISTNESHNITGLGTGGDLDENGSASNPLAKYQWDALSRLSLITYGDNTTDAYSAYDVGDNLLTLSQSFTGGQNNVTFSYSEESSAAVGGGEQRGVSRYSVHGYRQLRGGQFE
jgi:hypothetical protein